MYGKRLVVGAAIMLLPVPVSVMFLLGEWNWTAWLAISMSSFAGWGIGDLIAVVLLGRPRRAEGESSIPGSAGVRDRE